MTNWVMNIIEVKTPNVFECIIKFMRSEELEFDFNNLIPIEDDANNEKIKSEWGTLYNACDAVAIKSTQSFYFSTAWSIPIPIIKAFANIIPDMDFVWTWAEENKGYYSGKYTYNDGVFVGGFALDDTEEAYKNYNFCWGE